MVMLPRFSQIFRGSASRNWRRVPYHYIAKNVVLYTRKFKAVLAAMGFYKALSKRSEKVLLLLYQCYNVKNILK